MNTGHLLTGPDVHMIIRMESRAVWFCDLVGVAVIPCREGFIHGWNSPLCVCQFHPADISTHT